MPGHHAGTTVSRQAGLEVRRSISPDLPPLSAEAELVIYRVAQEALTNTVRHSGATHAWLSLRGTDDGGVVLEVEDDGRGIGDAQGGAGGIRGMRERALLVHGALELGSGTRGGTRVRLSVPRPGGPPA